jgi:hypothetical protein
MQRVSSSLGHFRSKSSKNTFKSGYAGIVFHMEQELDTLWTRHGPGLKWRFNPTRSGSKMDLKKNKVGVLLTVTVRVPADPNAPVETVYSEDSEAVLKCFGRVEHKRACFVEPGDPEKGQDPSQWYVDSSTRRRSVVSGRRSSVRLRPGLLRSRKSTIYSRDTSIVKSRWV